MKNWMKLLLTVLAVSAAFDKTSGYTARREEREEPGVSGDVAIIVVQAIQELMADLQDGTTSAALKDAVEGIIAAVDGVLADGDADVSEEDAQEVIENILETILGDVDEDEMKQSGEELDRSFKLLNGLSGLVVDILATPEREGLYEALLAIRITAASILDIIEDIGNLIIFSFQTDTAGEDGDDGVDDDGVDDDGVDDDAGDDAGDDAVVDSRRSLIAVQRRRAANGAKRNTCIGIGWNDHKNCIGIGWKGKKSN